MLPVPAQQTVGRVEARHLHVPVSQGFGGPYAGWYLLCAYMCTILCSNRHFSFLRSLYPSTSVKKKEGVGSCLHYCHSVLAAAASAAVSFDLGTVL
jgi:hypothetical protein